MGERPWAGKPECGTTSRQTGEPCRLPAGAGTDHRGFGACYLHLGRAHAQRMAAARELLQRNYGGPVEIEPSDALLDEVHRAAGHVQWLSEQVAWLGEREQLVTDGTVSVWLTLYQQERDRLVKASEAALRAGVAERRVGLAEKQGMLVAQAIRAILGELDLSPEQRAVAPGITRRHLLALPSPGDRRDDED